MSQSPIERFLDAVDRLDVDAAMALMAPDARVLVADGRRAEGTEAVRQLLGDFLGQLRSTTHRITAQWHQEDVWIAEVDASYELRDWLQLNGLPRAFVVRASPDGVSELRTYGAHEHRLSQRPTVRRERGSEGNGFRRCSGTLTATGRRRKLLIEREFNSAAWRAPRHVAGERTEPADPGRQDQ